MKYAVEKYLVSISRACQILGLARSTFDYEEHPRDDSEVAEALKELASENKRFGHPRLFLLLGREKEIFINHKRSERIYQVVVEARRWTNRSLPLVMYLFSFHISLEIQRKIKQFCGNSI